MITEKQQNKIVKKALGNIKIDLFIAVVTETPHPKEAVEVEFEGKTYFVTLSYGDFAVIYLN